MDEGCQDISNLDLTHFYLAATETLTNGARKDNGCAFRGSYDANLGVGALAGA